MQPRRQPKSIHATVLHDGRVLLELRADWYTILAVAESRVDEVERTTDILIGWAAVDRWEAVPRSLRDPFADRYREGYLVSLPGSDREIRRADYTPAALEQGFALAFVGSDAGSSHAANTAAVAQEFAREFTRWLAVFAGRSRRMAEARLAGGRYLPIMQSYLDDARAVVDAADQDYYEVFSRTVGAVLGDERYLLLSERAEARKLYVELQAEQSDLYNWYMNLAKGGVVGSRRRQGA
ncbi:hypothetical protein [Agromyces sp. Root81]|uniref:hypothetical protein n=1 Tax=Agromyces sp. Root81 TaxID=1736601 RepID=UPI000A530DFB|nr:hypothetical protein [Agromyces sp. Root81]